jgi:S-adenosylmethionine hydrolase
MGARLITLTSDFGLRDWFVGTMKGVILGIQPNLTLIDITHEVPPGDIQAGAFALSAAVPFFPAGSVHVVVVDPGVGTHRAALAVATARAFYVGPDNGVLSWALAQDPPKTVCRLENPTYFLPSVSQTFHGRDVFAPVAAHLSGGVSIKDLGPEIRDYVRLERPEPKQEQGRIHGIVIYIDRFGNAMTNIHRNVLPWPDRAALQVRLGQGQVLPVRPAYQTVGPGEPVALFSSAGFLEVAINSGSAAQVFSLQKGQPIQLEALDRGLPKSI